MQLGGDVDTLGAIVGSLAGIRHGISGIPARLVARVQASKYLRALAARYHAVASTIDQK
jgi:ADP-ribosylglycohydrolase